jgi:hypothetical protein
MGNLQNDQAFWTMYLVTPLYSPMQFSAMVSGSSSDAGKGNLSLTRCRDYLIHILYSIKFLGINL